MADWPLWDGQRVLGDGIASSAGVVLTANASANTKAASYTTIVASTAIDAAGIWVFAVQQQSTANDIIFDIAIGAAASETIILADLKIDSGTNANACVSTYYFPIEIPAGVRLSGRCASTTGANTTKVSVALMTKGISETSGLAIVDTYGANAADSGGVSIDPGGSANTKGTWVQVTASTTRDHVALVLGIGNQVNGVRSTFGWMVDIGIGASPNEKVLIGDIPLAASTNGDLIQPGALGPFFVSVPAGSRLSARAQCSGTDATDRLFDVLIYGVH